MTRDILLSIRPRFADAILAGEKTHELRRRFANAHPGTRVIIYASGSRRAVVGMFTIAAIQSMPTWIIARRRRRATTLSAGEIREYLAGSKAGVLIEVANPVRFEQPLSLTEARALFGIEPPQSYRYLPRSTVNEILLAARTPAPSLGSPHLLVVIDACPDTSVIPPRRDCKPSRRPDSSLLTTR